MKCDSCQEKATVFYTQVTDGKLKKFVLCETCAEVKGITKPEGLFMGDELLNPSHESKTLAELPVLSSLEKCSNCGFTFDHLQKIGRLGCPDCYRAFSGEIMHRLPSMHKGLVHTGYIPSDLVEQLAFKGELAELEAALNTAINEEDFEKAAKLRDRITELSSSKQEGSSLA